MDSINELRIDPEFAEKIPPLTPEEYEQLEANILSEGAVLSPLIIWNIKSTFTRSGRSTTEPALRQLCR